MLALPRLSPPVPAFPVKFEDTSPTRPSRRSTADTADWPAEEDREDAVSVAQERIRWELRTEREEYIASLGECQSL